MNRGRLALLWLLSSAVLAAFTSWAVLRWHVRHEHRSGAQEIADSEERFHAWVHDHLDITPEQEAALHAAEDAFAEKRQSLRAALRTANEALRTAILRDRENSAAVQAATGQVSEAQAALQRATLGHLFAMAAKLDPSRRDQLIHWLHDSLQPVP